MKKGSIVPNEIISNKIYFIRNQKLYAIKNIRSIFLFTCSRKFPKHFMFRLTEMESELMVSQNAIPSKKHLGGSLPYVFTEHGILQLSNVIKSERATQMSIKNY